MKLATIALLICAALMFGLTTGSASAGHYGDDDYYGGYDEYDYGFPRCGCCHLYCGFGYRSDIDTLWYDDDDDVDDDDNGSYDRDDSDDQGRDEDDRDEDDSDDDDVGV